MFGVSGKVEPQRHKESQQRVCSSFSGQAALELKRFVAAVGPVLDMGGKSEATQ